MPRQPRIDIEDQLYHVIARGIERKKIFLDSEDYEDFIARLKYGLEKSHNKCLAWSLLPNHFHLLILRGKRPLSELMRSLVTGYAVNFNIRHRRAGHLFQNRYKAILCEKDLYLRELIAYIHLNPLRAGLVRNRKGLLKYKWCGHGELLVAKGNGITDSGETLSYFGENINDAKKGYEKYISDREDKYKKSELSGGGLIKSMGGISNVLTARRSGEKELSDERILGSGEFVDNVLRNIDNNQRIKKKARDDVIKEVGKLTGMTMDEIYHSGNRKDAVYARSIYCYKMKEEVGISGAELMKELKKTSGAISQLINRGAKILRY